MKAFHYIIPLVLFCACKHTKNLPPEFGEWQIDQTAYARITHTSLPPSTPPLRAYNKNRKLLNRLEHKFPPADYDYKWVTGVYNAQDADRYRRTRNKPEDVTGAQTMVLQISSKTNKDDPFYFDIMFICPPPTGTCDLTDSNL
jgi:hypothetical protein